MKNIVSGMIYLGIIGLIMLIILMVIAILNKQVVIFQFTENDNYELTEIKSEKPKISNPTSSNHSAEETGSPDITTTEVNEKPIVNDSSVYYDGDLELPINGATGYASVDVTVFAEDFSSAVTTLKAGAAFLIRQESGDWWQISVDGKDGWVDHNYCMINLPDVIPSIIYDNTNVYQSLFRSSGERIPNITGQRLYSYTNGDYDGKRGRVYNERLQKYEYIVPVLYSMSKVICKAQSIALQNGETLVIYEGFRPYSVQIKVAEELQKFANEEPYIRAGINTRPWSIGWFISTSVSNHQNGYAIDTSLANAIESSIVTMVTGKYKYIQIESYFEYYMPTPIHELSMEAAVYKSPNSKVFSDAMNENQHAQDLQKYCMDAGLTPLASEWWHFNDENTNRNIKKRSNGNYEILDCLSVPPS